MPEFTMRKPILSDKEQYLDYMAEWTGLEVTPGASRLGKFEYEDWLSELKRNEDETTVPEGWVPNSLYLYLEGERIIGAVGIRHRLNDRLFAVGGHIGYGIRPSERGKGKAKRMLELALKITHSLGIKYALVTCNEDNLPSRRTIESCGGVLENKIYDIDLYVLRFWIPTGLE